MELLPSNSCNCKVALLLLIQVSCKSNAAKLRSLQIEQSQLSWAALPCQANSTCRWYAAQCAGAHHDITTRQILHDQVQPLLILQLSFPLLKFCNSGQDTLSGECMTACRRCGCFCTSNTSSSRQSLIWKSTGAHVRWTAAIQHLTSVAGGTSLVHAGECRA